MSTKELGDLTRREFGIITLLGATLPSLFLPPEEQQNRRYHLTRTSPINLDSISFIQIFKEGYAISSSDRAEHNARLNTLKTPFVPEPVESYEQVLVKIEPDSAYAAKLNEEAKRSIDDIFKFLLSKYIQKPDLDFKAPKSADEIAFVNGSHSVHVVADIAVKITVRYRNLLNSNPKFLDFTDIREVSGIEGKIEPIFQDGGVDFVSFSPPILYKSTASLVDLINSPPTEALHRAVRNYTIANIYRDAKDKGMSGKLDRAYVEELAPKHSRREELFVHAITILWLRDYNKRTRLGISERELSNGFLNYEQKEDYRGTNQLSRRISRLGVPRAIDLYVNNPEQLFKGIPN